MFGSLFLLNHTVIIKLKVRIKKKNTINTNRQRRDATIWTSSLSSIYILVIAMW
jgi:hypothetical protein